MGDMICALPMIYSLRKNFPQAKLLLVTKNSTRFGEIFTDDNKPVDNVFYYEKGFENFLDLVKELTSYSIDIAVIPSTVVFSSTNHFFGYYSKSKIRAGVNSKDGEDNPCSYLLNVKKDFDWKYKKVHQIERNLDIIIQLGCKYLSAELHLEIPESNKNFAEEFLNTNYKNRNKIFVGVHPGAAKEGNVWSPIKYAEVLSALNSEFDINVFLSEGPDDKKYSDELKKILTESYQFENLAVYNGTLMNDVAIISFMNLFITNDTGISHIASGLDIPVITLFGPTYAYEWAPVGENKFAIQSPSKEINDIDADKVLELCRKILLSV